MDRDRVVAAVTDWVYVWDDARTIETEEYLVSLNPPHVLRPITLQWLRPRRPAAEVVAEVLEVARGAVVQGREAPVTHLDWRLRLDTPPEVEPELVGLGARVDETLDIFALDLTGELPPLEPPSGLELRWATDLSAVRDQHRIEIEVFGGGWPSEAAMEREALLGERDERIGRGGVVVAYADGEAVGMGGLSSRGPACGLWGGAVLPHARGRGIYSALVAARLRYAVAHSMDLGLVKGRVQTSGPILRRLGFEVFGQERSYLVPLATRS